MAIDFEALAKKHGGSIAEESLESKSDPDFEALASKYGGQVEANTDMPSQIDVQAKPKGVFGYVEQANQPAQESWWDKTKGFLKEGGFTEGVLKGAASTVAGAASIGEKALNKATQKFFPGNISEEQAASHSVGEQLQQGPLKPENAMQKAGFAAEQIGEFFVPTGAAGAAEKAISGSKLLAKAPKVLKTAASILTKGAVEGAETLARTSAQHGAVDEEAVKSAKLAFGLSTLGSGVEAVKQAIGGKMGGRIVNSLIKPSKRDFSYGKNPGKTLAEEGIVANNLDDLVTGVNTKRQEIGGKIAETLKDKTVSVENPLAAFDEAIKEAAKGGQVNANLVKRLKDAKEAIKFDHTLDEAGEIVKGAERNFSSMSGEVAKDTKGLIGSMSKWTENPSDDEVVNKALQKVYGKIKEGMEKAAPGVKALNQKYADLLSASSALNNRIKVQERLNMVGLGTKAIGSIALASSFADGNLSLEDLIKTGGITALSSALGSPAAKTRIASWLASTPQAEKEKLFRTVPGIIDVIGQGLKSEETE